MTVVDQPGDSIRLVIIVIHGSHRLSITVGKHGGRVAARGDDGCLPRDAERACDGSGRRSDGRAFGDLRIGRNGVPPVLGHDSRSGVNPVVCSGGGGGNPDCGGGHSTRAASNADSTGCSGQNGGVHVAYRVSGEGRDNHGRELSVVVLGGNEGIVGDGEELYGSFG